MAKSERITLKTQQVKGKGKSEKKIALLLQGELTLDNASRIKDFLLDNLQKYNEFNVKINSVENLDLGAVQLLQRFQWDVQAEKKVVTFNIDLPDEITQLLENAGLHNFLSLSK